MITNVSNVFKYAQQPMQMDFAISFNFIEMHYRQLYIIDIVEHLKNI